MVVHQQQLSCESFGCIRPSAEEYIPRETCRTRVISFLSFRFEGNKQQSTPSKSSKLSLRADRDDRFLRRPLVTCRAQGTMGKQWQPATCQFSSPISEATATWQNVCLFLRPFAMRRSAPHSVALPEKMRESGHRLNTNPTESACPSTQTKCYTRTIYRFSSRVAPQRSGDLLLPICASYSPSRSGALVETFAWIESSECGITLDQPSEQNNEIMAS